MTRVVSAAATDAQLAQRMVALRLANEVRFARKRLKADLRAGKITLLGALDDPCAQGMRLGQLLEARSRWGPQRTAKALRRVEMSYGRRLSVWMLVGSVPGPARGLIAERCQ